MHSLTYKDAPLICRRIFFAMAVSIALYMTSSTPGLAQTKTLTEGALYLTDSDWTFINQASSRLFSVETPKIGSVETWSNPESGNRGSVTLITLGTRDGMICRRLKHDIKVKQIADPFSYTIDSCKTADGTWRVY